MRRHRVFAGVGRGEDRQGGAGHLEEAPAGLADSRGRAGEATRVAGARRAHLEGAPGDDLDPRQAETGDRYDRARRSLPEATPQAQGVDGASGQEAHLRVVPLGEELDGERPRALPQDLQGIERHDLRHPHGVPSHGRRVADARGALLRRDADPRRARSGRCRLRRRRHLGSI